MKEAMVLSLQADCPPQAPPSVNAEVMSGEEIMKKLKRSLESVEVGNCKPADEVFPRFMESHGYEVL